MPSSRRAKSEIGTAISRRAGAAQTHAAILGQLAEGVIVTDAAGRITLVNAAAAKMHGVARLEVKPGAYSRTYHLFTEAGDPHPVDDLPLARAVRGETVRGARWRIRRPDGSEILAVGDAQPLRDENGGQLGAVLTLRDDTARDEAERKLRALNATLAFRVTERTREAEAARRVAERASAAKSDFLAAMSHEIRTPLTSVIGYTELLAALVDPAAEASRHVARIAGSGAALLTLVDDILTFSRMEAGHVELARERFSVAELVEGALAIVRPSADIKSLRLVHETRLPCGLCAEGDVNRLRQVLLNLLNNAIKFTRRGAVTLRVGETRTSGGEVGLRFEISDTGIGVSADKQAHLFERFYQVDGGRDREHGGSGLGLAISKGLVERMGGRIGVASEEGAGATFWFEVVLPAAQPVATTAEAVGDGDDVEVRTVLVVDDMAVNQRLARLMLQAKGHRVETASSAAEAIEAMQRRAYDVVLMDIQMPGMDGLAATRCIRRLAHPCAETPIVALSASVLPEQVAAALNAGMDGHLGKPFSARALDQMVQSVCASRSRRSQGAAA